MFYMKNDDMDDMMRKAADEYELNHEKASDWNKVFAGIRHSEQNLNARSKQKKRKRYLLFLWLMLGLAVSVAFYKLIVSANKTAEETTAQPKATDDEEYEISSANNNTAIIHSLKTASKKNNKETNVVDNNSHKAIPTTLLLLKDDKNKPLTNTFLNLIKANNNDKGILVNSNQNIIIQKPASPATGLSNQPIASNKIISSDTSKAEQQISIQNADMPAAKKISRDSSAIQSAAIKIQLRNNTRQAFVYAGIQAVSDVSFVKNQKASSPALGVGIAGGYHFKNGVSIEAGLIYERKNYYTKGEYFNTDKLSYLQSVKLLATNGNCYMYEIPLNINYDFKPHKKYNWFVTAGASSYLMHKEYYNFKYDNNGNYGEKSYDYYHSSQNWFAILNLGAGVNIQTSDKYFIKVQPYYKAPLSGIGIGKLSLGSAGINIALTRRIH